MRFYPGSVHLLAGMAGTYKSMITMQAVINMNVPTFVFSTDSDDLTMAARLYANATGKPYDNALGDILRQPDTASSILKQRYGHIKWSFISDLDGDELWNHLYAYATRYGEYPKLIVVDILSDVVFENAESEWAALRSSMKQLNIVARETSAAVILVHHVTEGARTNDMFPCPGRADIMGKDSRHPVLMVTFGKDGAGDLHVACVKLRHGTCDATGRTSFRMSVDPETSRVNDWQPHQRAMSTPVPAWRGWTDDTEEE